jgi:type I restriction-modification system, S subunit
MEEWKEYKLGDVLTIKYGKDHKQLADGDIPIYGSGGIMRYGERSLYDSPSILIPRKGSLNNVIYADKPFWTVDTMFWSIINASIANPLFVYYSICKKDFASLNVGSAVPSLTVPVIEDIDILLPSKATQDKVVSVLKSLDDKIELNRHINDNLEQQAQALFKSWFVDNPNSNWKKISLSEVASFVGGYSYTGKELTDFSNVAMATIKNFVRNGGFKAGGFKGINPSAKLKECHYANLFDILVAHTDLTQNADVIGNTELLLTCGKYNSIIFSMDLVKVLPKEIFPYRFLLATMLKNKMFKGHCLGYINGTTVLHLNKKALPEFEIRKPSDSEAKIMNEILAPYYKRMAKLLQETDKLISLRDTLLPKLMSGELKINDINN